MKKNICENERDRKQEREFQRERKKSEKERNWMNVNQMRFTSEKANNILELERVVSELKSCVRGIEK